jgi:hypothetical protein
MEAEGFWVRGTIHDVRTSRPAVGINCGNRVSERFRSLAMKTCRRKDSL